MVSLVWLCLILYLCSFFISVVWCRLSSWVVWVIMFWVCFKVLLMRFSLMLVMWLCRFSLVLGRVGVWVIGLMLFFSGVVLFGVGVWKEKLCRFRCLFVVGVGVVVGMVVGLKLLW